MLHTHYADASGYSTASESTAADVLIVAARDMANPTFASIVQMTSVTLPVAGTVSTYTPFLGFIGVIGVKSGFTSAAGGCDVMAVVRVVHGVKVVILAAVTGQTGVNQPNVLQAAGGVALGLVDTVTTSLGSTSVVRAGTTVAHVTVEDHTVDAVAQSTVTILTWPGLTFTRVLEATHSVSAGAHRGADVGFVVVALGNRRIMVPVRLNRGLPKETLRQRLL
jgi:D-alanyl-D-alanine carboxypeptidase (penicillin-binding protein 5/6)